MTQLVQNLVDGLGRGSTYALFALGITLIFGVMHLVNFAHGELLTISAYTTYWLSTKGIGWWVAVPAILAVSVLSSMAMERVAFRRVRGASPFTLLLTSFALEILLHAIWQITVSAKLRQFPKPEFAFNTIEVAGIRFEVMDIVTIVVTALVLVGTVWVFRRTMFGIAVRGASEDFDAARLMGVRANRVISGAFAFAGLLAGIASVLMLMRLGAAKPDMGSEPLLKAVIAAIIGGLALGVAEAMFRSYLPSDISGLTDAFVFALIAILFIVRPQGLFEVQSAERV